MRATSECKRENAIYPLGYLTIAIAMLFPAHCRAQTTVGRFVRENAQAVHSLNFDEPFADLESVGKAIGDTSIVMLGEQAHGDGSTFLAKSRLIKYLHVCAGFYLIDRLLPNHLPKNAIQYTYA
ncbi:hypothetical protein J2Y45_001924 [Dyadobacter sp. BE34]|uniref:Erythromycin esterase n=1 Tax=Dyadobacter fermentans TaxID=94254 RepID=A0ABU1QX80_9BACT|nr:MULTISPECIES: hypothetical protein [Dyadobacter]MDR6805767.1 hypothetical protein [Dyadobacter fermentans]MDR7042472.1 hypothetical protein [Dyadobacter sp. BE242]MDR7196785.1 hypothetical protein [Dyadobacter sp. BE34]MDR7215781.1 hypothetical protein [Dyadobacter sp. BE31]MDR7263317.1 hypothetical protein [Dyadobacter sp. BE32]